MVKTSNTNTQIPAGHTAVSRLLSKILRHEPELIGIQLDTQGWVSVHELVHAIERTARTAGASKRLRTLPRITKEVIEAVVATSDKQRFSLSPDGKRIRAAQGHSIDVDLGYSELEPPAILYHGTAWSNWASISVGGLTSRSRHAVHLSMDTDTATRVGARHGQPLVLVVQAGQMHADGYAFACSDNRVWLTKVVPPAYLSQLKPDGRGPKS